MKPQLLHPNTPGWLGGAVSPIVTEADAGSAAARSAPKMRIDVRPTRRQTDGNLLLLEVSGPDAQSYRKRERITAGPSAVANS